MLNELKFNDPENQGFYEKVSITRKEDKVEKIAIASYTPENKLQGDMEEYAISRPSARKIEACLSKRWNEDEKCIFFEQ